MRVLEYVIVYFGRSITMTKRYISKMRQGVLQIGSTLIKCLLQNIRDLRIGIKRRDK